MKTHSQVALGRLFQALPDILGIAVEGPQVQKAEGGCGDMEDVASTAEGNTLQAMTHDDDGPPRAFDYDAAAKAWFDHRDEDAFNEIVRQITPLLWRLAKDQLPNLNKARDAVEDTLAWVATHPSEWETRSHFLAFCCGCLRNNCRNSFKKWLRRLRREVLATDLRSVDDASSETSHEEDDLTPKDPAATPSVMLETSDYVEAVLSKLKPEERQVLTLRDIVGMDFAEVAQALELPSAAAAKSAHERAMQKARKISDQMEKQPLRII